MSQIRNEPLSPAARQNSQQEQHTIHDACIIGGGVIGCSIARELSRYDIKLVLLEKNTDVAEGTTKANSAIVHAGYDGKPGSEKARTNVKGNQMFEAWCRELHVPFKRNTSLVLSFSDDGLKGLTELKTRGEANGVKGLHLLDRRQLQQREPRVSPAARAALLAETGGICCPYELTVALASQAVLNGLDLRLSCQAGRIRRLRDFFEIETSQGIVRSRILINAAGVYADEINNQLSSYTFKITARRGEYWLLDKAASDAFTATIFQMPTAMGKGILVSPTVDGTLILGPTAEDVPDKEDVRTTQQKLAEILETAAMSWADIPRHQFITAFSGLRAHADTNDFILGLSHDVPGLINAAGIESPGLTSAPAIGQELAELAAGLLQANNSPEANRKKSFEPAYKPVKPFREMNHQQRHQAILDNPRYGRIICRCEQVSEAEIRDAIRRPVGATTLDGVKRRTRAGMGRCQGGFCTPKVLSLLSEELEVSPLEITKAGGRSQILTGRIGEAGFDREEKRQHG